MKDLNRVHDLTNQKIGRLTVIGLDYTKKTRKTFWICQCECGNIKSVRSDALINHKTLSCGCLHKEVAVINVCKNHKHKQSGTRLYAIWQSMKKRCYNPHDLSYKNYGGRGITICDEWQNNFKAFYEWAQSSGYSEKFTIDRINVNGNYEPNNCRWITNKEQCENRRSNINITIGNNTKTLKTWCEIFDLNYSMVNARYHRMLNKGELDLDKLFRANTEINK